MKAVLIILIATWATFTLPLPQSSLPQTGKVKGNVTDSASEKIPKVKITFDNRASGIKQQIVSDSEGAYEVELPVGDYQVNAEAEGYRPPSVRSIRLDANQTAILNIVFPPISTFSDPNPIEPKRKVVSKRRTRCSHNRTAQLNKAMQLTAR
jgi:hypothetical protein